MCKEKGEARKAGRAFRLYCKSVICGRREGRKKAWVGRMSHCHTVLRNVQPGDGGALESHVSLEWACLYFPTCSVIVGKPHGTNTADLKGPPANYAPSSRRSEGCIFIVATSGIKIILTVFQIKFNLNN